jgi:flagellar biosynthesis protein FlhB
MRDLNTYDYFQRLLAESESSIYNIHLQWFAAEDEGRTEDPTEHKIRKAREDGKVAKSSDLSSSVVLLFCIIALALIGPYILQTSAEMLTFFLGRSAQIDVTGDMRIYRQFMYYFIRLSLPIAGVAFVAAILGNIIQVGFLFTVKTITPDFKKIVPKLGKFLQRAIFSTEALFNLGKSIFKVAIIATVSYLNIRQSFRELLNLVNYGLLSTISIIAATAFRILIEAAIILLVLSFVDYAFQRRQHRESLKMTKQEIREERKTYEGDPLVRSRLRERMRELLSRTMIQNVPQADVVITNPTHFAVALEYQSNAMLAPTVTAKGQDNIAFRIKEVALENQVPVVENKPLARALYSDVEIGDSIPEKYYQAVATVLSHVYKMSGKSREAV